MIVIYLFIYIFISSQSISCFYKYVENEIVGISNLTDLLDKVYIWDLNVKHLGSVFVSSVSTKAKPYCYSFSAK